MLPADLLGAVAALLAAAVAQPQTGARWPGSAGARPAGLTSQFMAPPPETTDFIPLVLRQGRRIPAGTATNQLAATTTTARPNVGKKLVTLRPIGNNIQEILYNNNYRETPGEREPGPNNIDDHSQLDGLHPSEVWLLEDDLLVLKGGELAEVFVKTAPIDDFVAPYREPRFPPPGFNPDGLQSPGMFSTAIRGRPDRRQGEPFIPEFGYNPSVVGRSGRAGQRAAAPRHVQFPVPVDVPHPTHQHATYVKRRRKPVGFIHNLDGLPRSFSTSNSYPAAVVSSGQQRRPALAPVTHPHEGFSAPATTMYDANGNYMTYTNHNGGYSYSYKTDGKAR